MHGQNRKKAIGFLVLFSLWEIGSRITDSRMFPPFSFVIKKVFILLTTELVDDIWISMQNIVLGFALATVMGFLAGILISQSRLAELILMPIVDAIRPVAALTLFPFIIIVLGLGLKSKVFVIFWTAWPPVLLNTYQGIKLVDEKILGAASIDGADQLQKLIYIAIPLAADNILMGLRIGLSGGWISLVSAEMLGSSAGLGYSILAFSQTFRFEEMYAVIIVIALLGLGMNITLSRVQEKINYRLYSKEVEPYEDEKDFMAFGNRAVALASGLLNGREHRGR